MEIFYKAKSDEELVLLGQHIDKFTQCYEIISDSNILIEKSMFSTIIKPVKKETTLKITKKPNINEIIKKIELEQSNECPSCSPNFYENIQETYCNITIAGTHYNIKLKGYVDEETSNFSKSI